MTIRIVVTHDPPGKLADAELHFTEGPLAGMKLVGFSVWSRRGGSRNVTFPCRAFKLDGARRTYAVLRPAQHRDEGTGRIRDLILDAYQEHQLAVQASLPAVDGKMRAAGDYGA